MEKRRDLEHAADEIEQLFADLWQVFPFSRGGRLGFRPHADCYRSDDPPRLTVLIELPGIEPEDVHLMASASSLLVAGERRRPKECGSYQQMEIDYGPFRRQLMLAEEVDPEGATATYERGILVVRLPIAAKRSPGESVSIEVRTTR